MTEAPATPPELSVAPLAQTGGGVISLNNRGWGAPVGGTPLVVLGTGRYIEPAVGGAAAAPQPRLTGGDVTLDFVGVDVRDVVRSVLGDLLQVSYQIDPAVQGTVTLQTGRAIPRGQVLPTLENALRLSGIALVPRDGVYTVLPITIAIREAQINGPAGTGFLVRVYEPRFTAAADLQRVLEPLLPAGTTLRADAGRNVLILSGTAQNVQDTLRDIQSFDVDYLRGLSFALLPLRNAQARDLVKEVNALVASSGATLAGLVKISAVDRLNAVLVTAVQPAYLQRVRGWIEKLDRIRSDTDQQLYVYRVQNGRAGDLSATLRRALRIDAGPAAFAASGPAASAGTVFGPGGSVIAPGDSGAGGNPLLGGLSPGAPASDSSQPASALDTSTGGAPSSSSAAQPPGPFADVTITSDDGTNALIISATPQQNDKIEAVLRQLDLVPLQVLIDATIAELDLTSNLSFGLQYFIRSPNFQALLSQATSANVPPGASGTNLTSAANATSATSNAFNGFAFGQGFGVSFGTVGGSNVILNALKYVSNVKVLSAPNLLVLNNQSARILVGDQVPVTTQQAISTQNPQAPLVNSVQYRDTGVILKVTPRVNSGGLVLLDLTEEVSQVSGAALTPTISQRKITSTIAVSDQETIGLGGLITDGENNNNNGIPFLSDLPVIGALFGTRNKASTRTELIVLITPHVIRNRQEADAVTAELQAKLPLTIPTQALKRLP